MPQQIKRLGIAFAIFMTLFMTARFILKPKSFGQFGHYRGDALAELQQRTVKHVGDAVCAKCHSNIMKLKMSGPHKILDCELCHGPGYKHAMYSDTTRHGQQADSIKLNKPTERAYCSICHQKNAARIKKNDTIDVSIIKMIDVKEHNLLKDDNKTEYLCTDCHISHSPLDFK